MANLEIAMLVGKESKEWLADLTNQIDRLEKLTRKNVGGPSIEPETKDEETADEESDDFMPPKAAKKVKAPKKVAASFDDEVEEETDEIETASLLKAAPKKTKAKKNFTTDDVNDACKARAGRTSIAEVRKLLKKSFGVTSITELEEEQYGDVIAALQEE